MTTYAAFAAWAAALAPTGVQRQYDYQPAVLDIADGAAQFVRLPGGGTDQELISTCSGSGKARTIELVVCVEAIGQNNPEPNFDATVAMMDAVETAIDAATKPGGIVRLEYDITSGSVTVGEGVYWAVIAAISGVE